MNGKPWTQNDVGILIRFYADTPTAELASLLGHSLWSVYGKARSLGLSKSPDFIESAASGRLRRGGDKGKETRFPKGHVPANKGLRRPGYAPGRMKESQFSKGEKPHNHVPIGSERLMDGYLQRKMTDTGYPPRDWRPVHRLIWEEANGPIPPGNVLTFVDGDRTHIELTNLKLISRQELAARNRMWNVYPRELAETIQLAGALKRKINRRNEREKQD